MNKIKRNVIGFFVQIKQNAKIDVLDWIMTFCHDQQSSKRNSNKHHLIQIVLIKIIRRLGLIIVNFCVWLHPIGSHNTILKDQ